MSIIDLFLMLGCFVLSAFIGWMLRLGATTSEEELDDMFKGKSTPQITKDCAKMFIKDILKFAKDLKWSKRNGG